MSQPVWTLSVDLQAKTAVFTSGLADAAKSARGSFDDIKDGARTMGAETSYSMTEARHSVMLLGEEFGIHLPRALTSFIASLGPIGGAMEAAFPFLAIAVGATLLLEHLAKLSAEGNKLSESQVNFGTTVANVMNGLNEKLLQAGIRTDELNHDHLGALNKQLQMIDHTSMNELVTAFGVVSKAADATFAELKTSWYQWGAGSAGAKNALEQFKTQYDSLLAQGKDKDANDLLAGTLKSAQKVLDLQKEASGATKPAAGHAGDEAEYMKFQGSKISLQKQGIGFSLKEVEAQQTLVDALSAQVNVQAKVNELKAAQSSNAKQSTSDTMAGEADKAAREQAQVQSRAMEEADKLWEANYKRAVSALQENERQKIEATEKGSASRLSAIGAAIKEEESKGLQETGFYRELLNSRIALTTQMAEELKKIQAEAGKEEAEHAEKMGELQIAADREAGQLRIAQGRMTEAQILDMEMSFNAQEYDAHKQALNAELAALDSHAKDYENKKKALNDRLLELDKQFDNQDQALLDSAQKKQLASIQASESRMQQAFAQGFTQVIMGKESFFKMMQQIDSQIASSALQNAMMMLSQKKDVDGQTRFDNARTAATDAFKWAGNPILGSIVAAGAFAAVMAFEQGGIVPGVGVGDTVPALLTPGEGVLNKKVMDTLTNQAKFGNGGSSGGDTHVHLHSSPTIHAIDGASVREMLNKHGDEFARHATNHLRKMNR